LTASTARKNAKGVILCPDSPRWYNIIFIKIIDSVCTFFFDVAQCFVGNQRYFCTGKYIGSGAFSRVFLGWDCVTAEKVAIKVQDLGKVFTTSSPS
jgi:hypothetical protein